MEEERARNRLIASGSGHFGFGVLFGVSARATRDSVAKTPYFLEHPLSGSDNGRDRRFKVQSGLSWLGEKRDYPSESSGDLAVISLTQDQG